ncbi:fimbria/pilus outer membrane usher protein [Pantoea sp. CCBC3-3-1]|uniref:fimbria/pilus outer membrane usher protein n=1 Tax=Pantoea sp. CCBC3-3-1 TaxID=2490851 RepID=UPI00143CFC4B|nr:fimbria/pilus outer membrane usher protein [Pantoea sp. CCBC3-3-1]
MLSSEKFTLSKIKILTSAAFAFLSLQQSYALAEIKFNPDFINNTTGQSVDVSRFYGEYKVQPGEYTPDIYLNGKLIGRNRIVVSDVGGRSAVCGSLSLIELSRIKLTTFSEEDIARLKNLSQCIPFSQLVSNSSAELNLSTMRLNLSVPQAHINQQARGYVPPSMWSYGENGLFANYNTNYFEQHNGKQTTQSFYGDFRSGINLGPWLLRHSGALRWNDTNGSHYNVFSTNIQRDIVPLSSRLLLGDANTSGEIFDTFSFRGLQLATADQMLPDSLRGYAPVVRGIAKSNARVTIRQRDKIIHETTVPPGEFSINDLYPTGYGGDLEVTVTESDGTQSSFSVPYASLAQLLRPGQHNYNLVIGQLRNFTIASQPYIAQATYKQGINNLITAYTGITGTEHWSSAVAGSALGTSMGAFALDVTGTRFNYKNETHNGASLRASYSKFLAATGSSVSLATYRFSSSGYLDLYNAVYLQNKLERNDKSWSFNDMNRPKSRVSLTLSQNLSEDWGQLYISGYRENYWNKDKTNTQYQLGYNNHYNSISYGLSVNKNITNSGSETQYLLNFTLPLSSGKHASSVNNYTTFDKNGLSTQLGLSGLAGERDQFNYNATAGRDYNNNYSGNISGSTLLPQTTLNGSYSSGKNYYAFSGGASGSIVGYSDGIVLSPYSNLNTIAIVSAKDAGGASVKGYTGVVLDSRGQAIVPYLNPYRINRVSLNPKGLPYDVELQSTSQQIAPHQGAIVKITYPTQRGRMVLIRASLPDGDTLPFGASVTNESGDDIGVVAQGGQIYVRLAEDKQRLTVHWGAKDIPGCSFDVSLEGSGARSQQSFDRLSRVCQPLSHDTIPQTSTAITAVAGLIGSKNTATLLRD